MSKQKIISFIRESRKRTKSDAKIRVSLEEVGWDKSQIEEAFRDTPHGVAQEELSGFTTTCRRALSKFHERAHTYIGITFFPTIASLVFFVFFALLIIVSSPSLLNENSVWLYAFMAVGALCLTIPLFFTFPALIFEMVSEKKVGIWSAYKKGLMIAVPFLGLILLKSFIVLGATALLVVPGVIMHIWFLFAFFIYIEEKSGILEALLLSREYVRGYWWQVLFQYVALVIGLSFFSKAIYVAGSLLDQKYITDILNIAFELFVFPFSLLFLYSLYQELRGIKGQQYVHIQTKEKLQYGGLALLGFVAVIFFGLILFFAEHLSSL